MAKKEKQAYLVMGSDGEPHIMTAEEYKKLVPKYTRSRMYRFMKDMAKLAQFPPDDFNFPFVIENTGVNHFASLADFDNYLYKYYGFGKAQIEFIERRYPYDDGSGTI